VRRAGRVVRPNECTRMQDTLPRHVVD